MVTVFVYGLMNGELSNITIGWDGDGNGCGYNATTKDYPFLYFPSGPEDLSLFETASDEETSNFDKAAAIQEEITKLLSVGVCVKECPTKTSAVQCMPTEKMIANSRCQSSTCTCNIVSSADAEELQFRYESTVLAPFGNGFCIPKPDPDAQDDLINNIVIAIQDSFSKTKEGDTW